MNKKAALLALVGLTAILLSAQTLTNGYLRMVEIAAPGTPASGEGVIYVKTDGTFAGKNDAGTETVFGADGSGPTIYRAVNDTTFTCQTSHNPIGEITFTSGQLEVGDVLQFEALMFSTADAAQTITIQYTWNGNGNPLANQQVIGDTGNGSHTVGSCYIDSTTSAVCRAFDSNTGTGAMDGAADRESVTLSDITASSNTLGPYISSCEGAATATVYHHTVELTR